MHAILVLNKRWSLTRGVSQRRDHCIDIHANASHYNVEKKISIIGV